MEQQTAVEWLDIELWKLRLKLRGGEISLGLYGEQEVKIIEQAKAMEKEQIIETWKHGNLPTFLGRVLTAEEYYNETFGGEK